MKKMKSLLALTLFVFMYLALCVTLYAQKPLKEYQKKWTPAPAVITKAWDVTTSSNNLGLELNVTPVADPPFTVQIHHIYSFMEDAYNSYVPGKKVQVRYDAAAFPFNPKKPSNKVVIEAFEATHADSIGVQNTLNLLKYDSLFREILSYGITAQAVVLECKPYQNMELKVKGNNPAITLKLEVKPEGRPSFKATVDGIIILESSIPKYQPGKTIYVKYDPGDLKKVAVYHSE